MTKFAEERAENYGYEQLGNLDIVNTKLTYMISDYLNGSARAPYLLVGGRGTGKTFNTMKVFADRIKSDPNFVPAMLVFKKHGEITVLEPEAIASPEVWGERIDAYDLEPGAVLRRADAVGFDDFHYISEEVAEGRYSVDEVLRFADQVLKSSREGKKTILISDTTLDEYAREIGSKEYDEMILKFGFCNPSWVHDREKAFRAFNERDAGVIHEVPAMPIKEWQKLFGSFRIKTDIYAARFLYDYNPKPRSLARFLNITGAEEKIEMEDLGRAALDMLKEEKLHGKAGRFYKLLFHMPVIVFPAHANYLAVEPTSFAAMSRYRERKSSSLDEIGTVLKIGNELYLPEVRARLISDGMRARARESRRISTLEFEEYVIRRNGAKKIAAHAESKGIMTRELKRAIRLLDKTPSIAHVYSDYENIKGAIDRTVQETGTKLNLKKSEIQGFSQLICSNADRLYARKSAKLDSKFLVDPSSSDDIFWLLDQPFMQVFNPVAAVD